MKIVLKLLLGVGSEEEFNPSPWQLLITALCLLSLFCGSLVAIIGVVSLFV
jgi:hypothetical protein|tara:strand:- start:2519 stop:2671 length:153 start_codon:yes stop_codon:yes gene_type:complete